MSIALRHRVERLEKFLQVRKLAVDQRNELVSGLAKMFDCEESKVEAIWDRTVGDAMLIPESMNVLMDELVRAVGDDYDWDAHERRLGRPNA